LSVAGIHGFQICARALQRPLALLSLSLSLSRRALRLLLFLLRFFFFFFFFFFFWCCENGRAIARADPAHFSVQALCFLFDSWRLIRRIVSFFTCAVSFTAGGRTPALLLSPFLTLSSCLSFFLFLLRFFFFFVLRIRRGNCECGSGPFFFFR
jgi:hypothetical protein